MLKFFVEILGDNACTASVLRDVIHTILRSINNPNLASLSCDLLKQIAVPLFFHFRLQAVLLMISFAEPSLRSIDTRTGEERQEVGPPP